MTASVSLTALPAVIATYLAQDHEAVQNGHRLYRKRVPSKVSVSRPGNLAFREALVHE